MGVVTAHLKGVGLYVRTVGIAGIVVVMAIIIMAAITLFSQLVLTIVFFITLSPIL